MDSWRRCTPFTLLVQAPEQGHCRGAGRGEAAPAPTPTPGDRDCLHLGERGARGPGLPSLGPGTQRAGPPKRKPTGPRLRRKEPGVRGHGVETRTTCRASVATNSTGGPEAGGASRSHRAVPAALPGHPSSPPPTPR